MPRESLVVWRISRSCSSRSRNSQSLQPKPTTSNNENKTQRKHFQRGNQGDIGDRQSENVALPRPVATRAAAAALTGAFTVLAVFAMLGEAVMDIAGALPHGSRPAAESLRPVRRDRPAPAFHANPADQ